MRRWSRPYRAPAACAAVLALAACAEDPVQPPDGKLRPPSGASFAVAADAQPTDLGTLGGNSSQAITINDSGVVVGVAHDTSGFLRAARWTAATGMVPLNVNPGPIHSLAIDVNSKGEIVGYVDSITVAYAFVWSPTTGVKWLPTLGGRSSYAYGINEHGDVVGVSETATGITRAFIWSATRGMREIGVLGTQSCASGRSVAWDINDWQEVVGKACSDSAGGERAFLWTESGGMRDLGTLGGLYSDARAINNHGHVVGMSQNGLAQEHAFLWTPTEPMRDLGTLGGDRSIARDINDAGEIVGDSHTEGSWSEQPFLWTPTGGMRKLAGLSAAGGAYGINATGQVVGWSLGSAGVQRATGWGVGSAPPPPPVNSAPVASAGGPYAALEGSPIAFAGSATDPDGDALSVLWTFGDGGSDTTASASHAYADNGVYTAHLMAIDSKGAADTATATVSVTNVAPRVTPADAADTVYSGATLSLGASFSDPGTRDGPWTTAIVWGDGASNVGSTGDQSAPITGTHQYFRAGTYSITVSVMDKDGDAGVDTVKLAVLRLPTIIDVDPKSADNSISIRSGGQTLAVALLSTPSYDARFTDLASIVVTNGTGSGARLRGARVGRDYEHTDVDRDGRVDLVLWFYKSDMVASGDLTTATTKLILLTTGSDGRETRGEDAVSVRP